MRTMLALVPLALAAACTHIDTGQTDYRVADPPGARTGRDLKACPDEVVPPKKPLDFVECRVVNASKVDRRYDPGPEGWRPIPVGGKYEITIEQGMIGSNILEDRVFGKEFGTRAEIAILANVFEFAGANDSDSSKKRFIQSGDIGQVDDPSDVELKLVYFGDDIARRQPFAFSNIPLRARGTYNGGSIGIQIVIMEVDAKANNIKSLLGTLARFGQQAVPGASEAKDLLFDLGESLFSSSAKDDRLFEYRFVLSAPSADTHSMDAVFAPGRYVVRRIQARNVEMDWSKLRLDHNTGRLMSWSKQGSPPGLEEMREDLYLTMRIRPYESTVTDETYQLESWEAFRKKLAEAADTDKSMTAVKSDLDKLVRAQRTEQWIGKLSKDWDAAELKLRYYSSRIVEGTSFAGCNVTTDELTRRAQIAERDAKDSILAFLRSYQAVLKAKDGDKPEVDAVARESIVSRVARYFMPFADPAAASDFAGPAEFEKAYVIEGSANSLVTDAVKVAGSRHRNIKTCDDLVTYGLAAR